MNHVFSDFLRRLTAAGVGGEPPGPGDYDEVLGHLRALLITELRRRGLWTSSPSFVGVTANSWHEHGALDELVHDVYTYIFIERQQRLKNQLLIKPNIEGLVTLNVRHFLTHRQRKADPLGFRIFTRLRSAIKKLLDLGILFIVGQRSKAPNDADDQSDTATHQVNNQANFSFHPDTPVAVANPALLAEIVKTWNDRRMPELVTAEGQAVPKVVDGLAEDVMTLPDDGVQAFRFQHLAKALKDDARRRWHDVWKHLQDTAPLDGEPGAQRVPYVVPDATPDWPRFRDAVLACVQQSIAAIRQAKKQRDLWTVWTFLRSSRLDTDAPQDIPSFNQMGKALNLPRERVSQLFGQLKTLVRGCIDTAGNNSVSNHAPPKDCPMAAPNARKRRQERNRS